MDAEDDIKWNWHLKRKHSDSVKNIVYIQFIGDLLEILIMILHLGFLYPEGLPDFCYYST
jgi:hypothetical protein